MTANDSNRPSTDTESPHADAFALVGHEIRVEILRVLDGEPELALSELRSRLNADVEPSQLHYHLQQLVGHFVEATDDGYRLRPVGRRLCLALHGGTFDRRQEHLTVDAAFDCYHCGAPVEAIFDNGGCTIRCTRCEHLYGDGPYKLSPEAFEDPGAAFTQASKHLTIYSLYVYSMARGFCWNCTHSLGTEFRSCEDDPGPRKVRISRSCDRCGSTGELRVGQALLADPGLRRFCFDHGVDILTTSIWELGFAMTDNHVTVRSTDPWEVALKVTCAGDTLELVVDGDLNVVERTRSDGTAPVNPSVPGEFEAGVGAVGNWSERERVLPDDDACFHHIRTLRWPDGVACPYCDITDTIKKGKTKKGAQRYRCRGCERIFNDLTDTVFAEHRFSLPEMVYVIREMDGTTAAEIARELDRSYKAVLSFVHEVRDAIGGDPKFDFSAIRNPGEIGVAEP